jgi:hypothetical protein
VKLIQVKPANRRQSQRQSKFRENRAVKGAQRPSGKTLDSTIFSEEQRPFRSTASRMDGFFCSVDVVGICSCWLGSAPE